MPLLPAVRCHWQLTSTSRSLALLLIKLCLPDSGGMCRYEEFQSDSQRYTQQHVILMRKSLLF